MSLCLIFAKGACSHLHHVDFQFQLISGIWGGSCQYRLNLIPMWITIGCFQPNEYFYLRPQERSFSGNKGRTIDLSPTASGLSSIELSLDKQLLWYASHLPLRDWCQINLHVISTFSTGFKPSSLPLLVPEQQLSGSESGCASAHIVALSALLAAQMIF